MREDSEVLDKDSYFGRNSETKRSIGFKSNNLCLYVGYEDLNDGELPHEGNNIEISINEIAGRRNLDLEED